MSRQSEGAIMDDIVTVTIQRTAAGRGVIDLTVVLNDNHEIVEAMDEDGASVTLNANETLLAECLAKNGVDVTGR